MAKLKEYGLYALIVILLVGWFSTCIHKTKESKEALRIQEQAYKALLADYEKNTNTKGDTVFVGGVVEGSPKDIVKSPLFAELDSVKQEKIKKLAEEKALLAALEARLELLTRKIDTVEYQLDNVVITDSTVIFPKGEQIVFEDTSGNYQYKEVITFSDSIIRDFKSELKLDPSFTFTRKKDKSIEGTVSFGNIEATEIKLTGVTAFYIPPPGKLRKNPQAYNRFMKSVKIIGIVAAVGLAGYGGFRTGVIIAQ